MIKSLARMKISRKLPLMMIGLTALNVFAVTSLQQYLMYHEVITEKKATLVAYQSAKAPAAGKVWGQSPRNRYNPFTSTRIQTPPAKKTNWTTLATIPFIPWFMPSIIHGFTSFNRRVNIMIFS